MIRTSKTQALKQGLRTGEVLICDFDTGFIPPEIVKRRPVVVISKTSSHWRGLCTVVPLSTSPPQRPLPWHVLLADNPLYGHLPEQHPFGHQTVSWAKCDLIYTVCFERITRIHRRVNGKRSYIGVKVPATELDAILKGVYHYLPACRSPMSPPPAPALQ